MATQTITPTMSSTYNLRQNPAPSKKRNLNTYYDDLYAKGELASPNTKLKISDELNAIDDRMYGQLRHRPDILTIANEIVSGGRPPDWYMSQHQAFLFEEWDRWLGKRTSRFKIGMEYVPWRGESVRAIEMKGKFAAVDMVGAIQGRSLTAKRLDGRGMGPEMVPDVNEMSWREWRRLSRACNLLLEAVDGVPWGWEMEDGEWEEFSRADKLFNDDRSSDENEKRALWKWENP